MDSEENIKNQLHACEMWSLHTPLVDRVRNDDTLKRASVETDVELIIKREISYLQVKIEGK